MSTTTYNEWHPHAGSVWARAVGLWFGYVSDTTLTLTVDYTTVSSHRALRMTIAGATDTTVWRLVDGSAYTVNPTPAQQLIGFPGWFVMPPVIAPSYGARDARADWHTNMIGARRDVIWYNWVQPGMGTERFDNWNINYDSGGVDVRYWTVHYDNTVLLDRTFLNYATQTSTDYLYNDRPICDGSSQDASVTYSSGGGSIDLAPVVSAIEDLSFIDETFTINNGADMFTVRGKIRVS